MSREGNWRKGEVQEVAPRASPQIAPGKQTRAGAHASAPRSDGSPDLRDKIRATVPGIHPLDEQTTGQYFMSCTVSALARP